MCKLYPFAARSPPIRKKTLVFNLNQFVVTLSQPHQLKILQINLNNQTKTR